MKQASLLLAALLACATQPKTEPARDGASVPPTPSTTEPGSDEAPAASEDTTARLTEILAAPHRSEENRVRDAARHPVETLTFFGVDPTDTVIELWPGGGWYTEILAPYLHDRGKLVVTMFDPKGPEAYYGTKQANETLELFAAQPELYGKVEHVQIPAKVEIGKDGKVSKVAVLPFDLAPEGSVDVVLTFRNSHGWYNNEVQELVYGAAFRALAKGGVFGVVQHRADEGADPKVTAKAGYLPEATVIAAAEAVGFRLAEKSEINANPKDTRDHPQGVWTLPPNLALGDKDRDKYLAIGESDRMTLKFVKP